MKAVWALVFLAVCAVLVVAFQAIHQEVNIRTMRNQISLSLEEVKTKEDEVLVSKVAMQKLSSQLATLDKQKNQLSKKMEDLVKQKETSAENLETCRTRKTEVTQEKSDRTSAIDVLRKNQNSEIQKLQEELNSWQKQVLDRDTKICLYVNKDLEEGRKLCAEINAGSKV
ncbi:uncharacterized protein Hap1MRO34_005099 [Clarias gariepinus]|uniref:uncharacterized protein si:dkey-87o1.2 n=1 Tax=Clarias gariepinus TaxID=13013 RepID=UPI00234D2AB3|nr:uncharacterized protein si:dkey-87o1.2 [Clarias gariepinus]